MSAQGTLQQLFENLSALGPRRLIALGLAALMVFAVIGGGTWVVSRPSMEMLYGGLEPRDATRIGAALSEAGIPYDVSPDGRNVLVGVGRASEARMLLAEKELPSNVTAGYELFDNLGSLGLTTFMQQVTQIRALEGELARSIQLMKGVRSARVHIVMPEKSSFRDPERAPSASVIVKTETGGSFSSARAIRHLVSAAIPGLTVGRVTVLDTDGTMLASGDDANSNAPLKSVDLERSMGAAIEANIRKTLSPFLGFENFQLSVSTKLNTDRKTIQETVFDPNSRVERSVRVTKEAGTSRNATQQAAASVEQEIPDEEIADAGSENSSEKRERREELTNYEVSSKTVATEKSGYIVEKLNVAIVINQARVSEILGASATKQDEAQLLQEIEALIVSAANLDTARGDKLKISSVDFVDQASLLEPVEPVGLTAQLMRHLGTLITALTVIVIALLFFFLGWRPVLRTLTQQPGGQLAIDTDEVSALGDFSTENINADSLTTAEQDLMPSIGRGKREVMRQRLETLVQTDQEQAAHVLRKWARAA